MQKHSSAVPHLHTSSGNEYALPSSPKTGRASKQSDKTTTDMQVAMCYYSIQLYMVKYMYIEILTYVPYTWQVFVADGNSIKLNVNHT